MSPGSLITLSIKTTWAGPASCLTADLKKQVHLDEQLMKGLTVDGRPPFLRVSDSSTVGARRSTGHIYLYQICIELGLRTDVCPCRTTVVGRNSDLPCVHGLMGIVDTRTPSRLDNLECHCRMLEITSRVPGWRVTTASLLDPRTLPSSPSPC